MENDGEGHEGDFKCCTVLARALRGAAVVLALAGAAPAAAEELPDDARAAMDEYQKAAETIQARADAELAAVARKVLPKLKAAQDRACKAAKLDEALAIREATRSMLGILPDPGNVSGSAEDVGKVRLYLVTGSTAGSVWGAEVYTTDSRLAPAAVHAGLLKVGEKAVIRVRIVAGQNSYLGTTANGVTSQPYGSWRASFTLDRPKDLVGANL